jgi:hypothetical protein
MKYLKKFETLYENPKIGHYVLCKEEYNKRYAAVKPFIDSNIGIITQIDNSGIYQYIVKYENIPDELYEFFDDGTRNMKALEIVYWTDDKSELESYLNSKKYNL